MAIALQHAAPAQVAFQIFGSHPVKAPHPLFEATVISVDILNMEGPINDAYALLDIDGMLERLVARQYVMRPPLSRLINQALPIMDDFTRKAEQSCHMGVYDCGNVLISAQINSPSGWSFAVQRSAESTAEKLPHPQVNPHTHPNRFCLYFGQLV